jgi:hypothetical protein
LSGLFNFEHLARDPMRNSALKRRSQPLTDRDSLTPRNRNLRLFAQNHIAQRIAQMDAAPGKDPLDDYR